MSIHYDFIEETLGRFEGKGATRGYVPCDNYGQILGESGVTIATGLDLGQQTEVSLSDMRVPPEIIALFAPYLGLKKEAAVAALKARPLRLTPALTAELDHAVHSAYIARAAGLFGEQAFAVAPKEVQAVAVSLHFQFGTPYRRSSPALGNAWQAMRQGRFHVAAVTLRDPSGWSESHQKYMKRRFAEAQMLDEAAK